MRLALFISVLSAVGGGGFTFAFSSEGLGVPFFSWFSPQERPLDPTGDNLLKMALEGDWEKVKDLVERGADVNYGRAAVLRAAAENGSVDMVKYLLEAGANPNGSEEDIFKGRILASAAKHGHMGIVNILLDAGADVHVAQYGSGVMDGASENGHVAIVKRLLEAGADPSQGDAYAMLLAAREGHTEVVKTLIEAGGDLNEGQGWIIDNAAEAGQLEAVKLLVESGADKKDHGSAMTRAARYGHLDVVKYFLDIGTDPNYGVVLRAAVQSGNIEIVRALLEAGSEIKYNDEEGPALHNAIINGNPEIVSLLVEYGADINRALIKDTWFDVSSTDTLYYGNGWTVVHVAARWGEPMIKELMALGADINFLDAKGNTPLQVALDFEKLFVAQELLKFCVDTANTNIEGKSASDIVADISRKVPSNATKYQALMDIMKEAMPEKVASTPNTFRTTTNLRKEFLSLAENNTQVKNQMEAINVRDFEIDYALSYIFEERNRRGIEKLFTDYKCKLTDLELEVVDHGTEYLVKCECIKGQGLQMTLTPIQDVNMCENTSKIQEETTTVTPSPLI